MGDQEHGQTAYKEDDPPPGYSQQQGGFIDRLKAAKTESKSTGECCCKTITIIVGSIWCTIFTGVMLIIPISMIAVGAVFLHDCEFERYIPIYLIVGGVFSAVLNIYRIVHSALGAKKKEGKRGLPFDVIMGLFLFCWFIAGNVWIYSIYRTVNLDDETVTNYCSRPLYLYAFSITTIGWIFILLSLLCGCLGGCVAACLCEPK